MTLRDGCNVTKSEILKGVHTFESTVFKVYVIDIKLNMS